MRTLRSFIPALVLLGFGLAGLAWATAVAGHATRADDGSRLMRAVTRYVVEHRARGAALPPSLAIEQLVACGYLGADEARAYDGSRVRLHREGNESVPGRVVADARFGDGTGVVLLGDGSVQLVAASRLEKTDFPDDRP